MIIINELVTPLNNEKEIDVNVFNKLINESIEKGNEYQLIFSPMGDGYLLTLEEKKALIHSIKEENIQNIILFFQLSTIEEDEKMIQLIQKSDIEYIMISPPKGFIYHQNGLFAYVRNIIKKLTNKKIILYNNPSTYQMSFHFQTIKKLHILFPNVCCLYENSKDISLLSLIKLNLPNINIFVNDQLIEDALKCEYDGIVSFCSLLYANDYHQITNDYKNKYLNKILINYLHFVNEILSFSNSSILFKAYLRKLGYQSMNVRLPLVISQSDIENLDFLLS